MIDLFQNYIQQTTKQYDVNSANADKVKLENRIHKRFIQVEQLTREAAYSATSKIVDEDGVTREYIVNTIANTHAGIVCSILSSTDPTNPRIHVLFRGTHNYPSALRNLETLGVEPGAESFSQDKDLIINAIKTCIQQKTDSCKQPIELSVAGHSLGGGDAQRCVTAIFADLATQPSCLSKIGTLNIMTANSVGVSSATSKICKNSLAEVKKIYPSLQVNYYPIMAHGDGLQQAGYTRILAAASPQLVKTYLLKVDHGFEENYFKKSLTSKDKFDVLKGLGCLLFSHSAKVISEHNYFSTYKIYTNQVAQEFNVIKRELKTTLYKKLNHAFNPYKIFKKITPKYNRT